MLAAGLLAVGARPARAQCPDGTPPPCHAAPRPRANPAFDARAWIVVPFANVTRSPELDWLRDASVNLLTLDLERWNDITVVPGKRVSDLLRGLPIARTGEPLTLNDGLGVARRAGAGRLVMGDFYKQGKGARVVANVFDVRTGARVRSITQQVPESDSLLTAFSPLARGVLAVPPPPDARIGDLGTRRLDAYQEYLLGVKALHRFTLAAAREHLTRALALDSSFALAHLAYSQMLEWGELGGGTQAMTHALAAQRFGAGLPRRERTLIDAGVASASGDYARLCGIAQKLVAQDSTDIQGLFLLGECSFHDGGVVVSPTDSMVGSFRGNWNTAIRAFRRVITLDPTYLGAFEHVLDILQRTRRLVNRCPPGRGDPDCMPWVSWVLRSGDSLEVVPVRPGDTAATAVQSRRFRAERPRVTSLLVADSIAREWVAADSTSEGARAGLARVALLRGDLALAARQLAHVSPRATEENALAVRMKLEVAAKLGHGAEARAMLDSLAKAVRSDSHLVARLGSTELMLGRLARFERTAAASNATRPLAAAYARQVGRALLGVPRDEMARDEAAFYRSLVDSACDVDCRLAAVTPTLVYALHAPLGEWPDLAAGRYANRQLDAARAVATRDTAQLRRVAQQLESTGRGSIGIVGPNWQSVVALDAYLALRDSASALRMARFYVDTAMVSESLSSYYISGVVLANGAPLWLRMMMRRADLAAAAGHRAEARRWYDAVLDLWAHADPELEPVVRRLRASLAALGPPGVGLSGAAAPPGLH